MAMTAGRRVGIDATTWGNNRGFGRFTRELVRALVKRESGFEYTLVLDSPNVDELPPGARVVMVPTRNTTVASAAGSGARSLGDMLLMARAVARERFDLFFFPAVYSYFPLISAVPMVVAFHDTIAERYPRMMFPTRRNELFWRAKCALAKHQARRVMTVSRASAEDIERFHGVGADRIDLVTEAADPVFRPPGDLAASNAVRARYDLGESGPLFVYVGGLNPHKNLLGLLRGFERALAERPDARLAIVGDTSGKGFHDNRQELSDFVARSARLSECVRFTGYVSDQDLVCLYGAATALVLPSLWEGFGLPAVEAMACGLPVLASRRGSLPDVIGDAGLFFDPLSPDDIKSSLLRLCADPALAKTLGSAALARSATFTWDRGAELAERSFGRCLGESS
jgi:glycosyltransferase involved in cell wall biosynthesis